MSFSFTLQDVQDRTPDARHVDIPADIPADNQEACDEYRIITTFEAAIRGIAEQHGIPAHVDGQTDEWDIWCGLLYETQKRADQKKLSDYKFQCQSTGAAFPAYSVRLLPNETTATLENDEEYCELCVKYLAILSNQELFNQVASQAPNVGQHHYADIQFVTPENPETDREEGRE